MPAAEAGIIAEDISNSGSVIVIQPGNMQIRRLRGTMNGREGR